MTPDGLPSEETILGRAGAENFPVALRALPPTLRARLLAVYGYARLVDQLGDAYRGDRLAALDWLEGEVTNALANPAAPQAHPLVARVTRLVADTGADPASLYQLIAANRMDQEVTRYRTWADLDGYCQLSANPVGRLVLAAFGQATAEREAWSDQVCTGLQLVEHCQDVGEDLAAGRLYLPQVDLDGFGVTEADLAPGAPSSRVRGLLAFELARARRLLDAGLPLVRSLTGWGRLAVSGFVAGGYAAIDSVADAGYDSLRASPRVRPTRLAQRLAGVWRAA